MTNNKNNEQLRRRRMIYGLTGILLLLGVFQIHAQTGIDTILASIARNNKTLQAEYRYWKSQQIQNKTGLTPYDPLVSYDFMRGSPNNIAGNQTDINVVQSFDFPTVYGKKKGLAKEQDKQAEHYLTAGRQNILLDAKKTCIELVYRNKLQRQLEERKSKTEQYLNDFQVKLKKGVGNILDVNKTRLQLIEINKEYQLNISAVNRLNQKLTALNGGEELVLSDTIYAVDDEPVTGFEDLEAAIEQNDPVRKYLEQQAIIAEKQVDVTRAMTLPKFEAGYHYQGILGQRFHGGKVGMTIPLWENKNRVKQKLAEQDVAETRVNEHKTEHYYEVKQQFEKYLHLKKTTQEYRLLLDSISSVKLLDKALSYGEITTLQYFVETGYYYDAMNSYLLTEKEYYEALADLQKYKL